VWRDGHLIREERWQTAAIVDPKQFEISNSDGDTWRKPIPVHVLDVPVDAFGGIGVIIGEKYGPFKVLGTAEGSPAQSAGIQPGDMIRGINGMNLDGIPLSPFVSLCHGKVGTSVTLDLEKSGTGERKRIELRRAELKVSRPLPAKPPEGN
jgi:C-terminal processing protease CtpA/Prc